MNIKERIKLIYFALIVVKPMDAKNQGNGESSGEYLQKVMVQLQEFNLPSPVNVYDRISPNNGYNMVPKNRDKQSVGLQRINMNSEQNIKKYKNHSFPYYNILADEIMALRRADTESIPPHYQPQAPIITKVKEPEALGFTRAELAAMYKSALEKGSTTSLSSLTNALSAGEMPHVTNTHVELPVKQPLYQYYFFPLKTFMSEFRKDHGYKTIPVAAFDNTEAAQTTQTQLSSPLFVAISTFVTMAIVFMMSVLFLPKLPQFDILHSRAIHDDFFYLSNVVTNAIDRYNFLEKLKGQHMDSIT
ncbi:uncharacterized protein LOC143184210 [Calliopsis andreniformis]|uniref:uncharacterized protein LOC143184210 n=1 Tax=Calliopsis andreniformis TaxID=337506 RepID=UPI003FCD8CF5